MAQAQGQTDPEGSPLPEIGREPKIGERIQIWWPDDGAYYSGRVASYNANDRQYYIEYDDGETEYLDMKTERWRKIDDELTAGTAASAVPIDINSEKKEDSAPVLTSPAPGSTTNPALSSDINTTPANAQSKGHPRLSSTKFAAQSRDDKDAALSSRASGATVIAQNPKATTSTVVPMQVGVSAPKAQNLNPANPAGKPGAHNPKPGATKPAPALNKPMGVSTDPPKSVSQPAVVSNMGAVKRAASAVTQRPISAGSQKSPGSHPDVPKKKMRMMSSALSSAQVARAVTTGRMPQGGAPPSTGASIQAAGKPRPASVPARASPVTVNRTVEAAAPRVGKPIPMGGVSVPTGNIPVQQTGIVPSAKLALQTARMTLEEAVMDTRKEVIKTYRSMSMVPAMQKDLAKHQNIGMNALSDDIRALHNDIRRIGDSHHEIMMGLAQLNERIDRLMGYGPFPRFPMGFHPGGYRPMGQMRPMYPRSHYWEDAEHIGPQMHHRVDDRDRIQPYSRPLSRRVSADRVQHQPLTQSDSIMTQVKRDIVALAARQVMIWLLETDHEAKPGEDQTVWAQRETSKCMARVSYLLGKFAEYNHAYRVLSDSLGLDGKQLLWFTEVSSSENLRSARQNYDVWDPPPTDDEWRVEEKLLAEVERRFKRSLNNYEFSVNESTLAACINVVSAATRCASNGHTRPPERPNGAQAAVADGSQQEPPNSAPASTPSAVPRASSVPEGAFQVSGNVQVSTATAPGTAPVHEMSYQTNPNGGL